VGMINPVISAAYGRSREVLWRLPNRRAILRRPPFVSWRFQCRMTASGAQLTLSESHLSDGFAPIPAIRGRDGTSDRAEVPYEKVVAIQFADLWEG
jgi:hypothetical protein